MDNMILWVDDVRDPNEPQWAEYIKETFKTEATVKWVKSYDEFCGYMRSYNPLPLYISFDHDLGLQEDGTEKNGYDCAKFLIDIMMEYKVHSLPNINVHSANPVGKENIEMLFSNYSKVMCNIDSER